MATTQTTTPGSLRSRSNDLNARKISWPAIFAGALIALGIQILLSLLGMGIGMSSVDPMKEQNPMAGLGTGTLVWWIITFLLALFAGGWVAGRLSGTAHRFESILHGILTWVVFVMFNIYLLTSAAGSILNTAGGILGSTLSLAGQGATTPGVANKIEQKVDAQTADTANLQNQVDKLKAKAPEAEAKARAVGDDVALALSKAGFYSFIGLLLGAAIAAFAASRGRRADDDVELLDRTKSV